jgi:O-antigen/teichoic acid export membrane protein
MKKSVGSNIALRVVEAFVGIFCSLFQYALLSRSLSTEDFGKYSLVLTGLFFLNGISCLISNVTIVTKEITQGAHFKQSISCLFALQFILVLFSLLILILSFSILNLFPSLGSELTYVGVIFLLTTIPNSLQAIYSSKMEIDKIAYANIAAQVLSTILVAIFIYFNLSLKYVCLAYTSIYIFQSLIFLTTSKYKRYLKFRLICPLRVWELLKLSAPIAFVTLLGSLYVRIDLLMINLFLSKEDVALYSSAFHLQDYLILMANTIMMAVFPNFTALAKSNINEFKELYRQTINIFIYLFVPIAILIAYFAKDIVVAIYGSNFENSSNSLVILLLAAIFVWINCPSGSIFVSFNKQKIYVLSSILSLAANTLGNLILIPLIGIEGAALSTLFAEIVLTVYCLFHVHQLLGFLPMLSGNPICHNLKVTLLKVKKISVS